MLAADYHGVSKDIRETLESYEVMTEDGGEPPAPPPPVDPPRPGKENEGMEDRLTRLEAFAEDAKGRMTRVETKLDHIGQEVSNFKWWAAGSAVAIILAVIGAVLGTGVAIQQMTVSTFQAAGSQQQLAPQPPIIVNVPSILPAPPAGMK